MATAPQKAHRQQQQHPNMIVSQAAVGSYPLSGIQPPPSAAVPLYGFYSYASSSSNMQGSFHASSSTQLNNNNDDAEVDELDHSSEDGEAGAVTTVSIMNGSSRKVSSKTAGRNGKAGKDAANGEAHGSSGGGGSRAAGTAGTTMLPVSRVDHIVKADGVIGQLTLSKEAHFVISRATEEFIKRITQASHTQASAGRRNTVTYRDIASTTQQYQEFMFLNNTIPLPITLEEALQFRHERERELFAIASNPAVNDPSEPSGDGSTGQQRTPVPPLGSAKRGKARTTSQRASPNGNSNSNTNSNNEPGSTTAGSRRESGRRRVASARAAAAAGGSSTGGAALASTVPVEEEPVEAHSTGTWLPPPRSATVFTEENTGRTIYS